MPGTWHPYFEKLYIHINVPVYSKGVMPAFFNMQFACLAFIIGAKDYDLQLT